MPIVVLAFAVPWHVSVFMGWEQPAAAVNFPWSRKTGVAWAKYLWTGAI
jgi:hypothetical protein